ncbi:MAG: NADH-quinone oxidoreductase subunit NuoN [Caulobacterales bacterium]
MTNFAAELPWVQPELILAIFALAGAVAGAWFGDKSAGALSWIGALTLVTAGVFGIVYDPSTPQILFGGALVVDGFATFAKALIAFSAAVTLLLGADHFATTNERRFEFPVLTVLSVLGMFIMVGARDLITLYVGVELQSLAAYVLAAWRRDDARSSEAGLKYFVLGAISSGLLLYGASFVYGFTGSVRFDEIAANAADGGVGLLFGLVLMLCALGFKMSAAPFHMWTPDVYEGAPTPVTAFFSAAPKVAAVVLTARLLYEPFADLVDQWRQVVVALAAISMLVGAFAALVQTNLKRLMAYSSINNIGFALMALAAGTAEGAKSALLFLAIYLPSTIGVFAVILAMRRDGKAVETIDDLSGLATRRPWMAAVITFLMFSLAGVPPLAGFFGKLATFIAAVEAGLAPLAIVGGLAAVVAAAYYLRIVAAVWFKPAAAPMQNASGTIVLTASAAAALVFPILLIALGALESWAAAAIATSF